MMKKVFLFIGLFSFIVSCSVDDDLPRVRYEAVPVADVVLPDSLVFGQRYRFPVDFIRPTDCHSFDGFQYQRQDSTRFIYVVNQVLESNDCTETPTDTVETFIDFDVLYRYTYIFKFYQGQDANDEPKFLVKEVPVKLN